ncbi:hypothetical protein Q73_06290 [Bacillus coahuilensis m2-6]|uniref:DUF1797 family protein n=1 Tax=Bacillus coahuilensis p1.1.43 TaxID=1150625 RepID=A0A147K9F3_9BACI|nr:hypothetical protein [Bacillus coahuilensis]KUP06911.1 hypothetical protein Q75_06780 [Bacillus coahuilensis p1.1.43]KUP08352.1 hypothetical protein Q73_06290 [Bacillus coahuilensis m2-6]
MTYDQLKTSLSILIQNPESDIIFTCKKSVSGQSVKVSYSHHQFNLYTEEHRIGSYDCIDELIQILLQDDMESYQ